MTKIILLIGRSGRGKSTLANVITNTNNFKESSGSVSETKKIQFEQFADKEYSIIDTPGIGDTKMSDSDVLNIIAEAVYLAKDGIGQVFFVINGRFDQYEMATYDLLRTILFDKDITKHTTIVRTKFGEFEKPDRCQEDIDIMIKEAKETKTKLEQDIATKKKNKKFYLRITNNNQYEKLSKEIRQLKKKLTTTNLAEILESCQKKIVYVDNPSLKVTVLDNEDEKSKKLREAEISLNKNKRSESREILIEHLSKNCQEIPYKPPKLAQLSEEIDKDYSEYLKKKEELQKELGSLKLKKTELISSQISAGNESSENISKEDDQTELAIEEELQTEDESNIENNIEIVETGEVIAQLQDKKTKLLKEIAEKEKIIHQKVLKHIFNNYQEITQGLGGNIFLNSIAGDHDWTVIHPEFTKKELVVKWLSQGFDYQQTKDWTNALGDDFKPKIDADFCTWMRDIKQLTVDKVKRHNYPYNIGQLRKEYHQHLGKETEILDRHNKQLSKGEDWTDIHEDFEYEWQQKLWKKHGFDYQTTKEWKEILGENFSTKDFNFCVWLRDKKNLTPQKIKQLDNVKSLREEYQKPWTDIHKGFGKKHYSNKNDTCQQEWEEKGFTNKEAKEWISIGFTPWDVDNIQYHWKRNGFDWQQTREWKETLGENFEIEKSKNFCIWLRDEKHLTPRKIQRQGNLESLKQEYNKNWTDIHPDFSKYINGIASNGAYWWGWKEEGFAHQDAKKWIAAGFKPEDYYEVKEWKNCGFKSSVTKKWITAGFKLNEAEKAKEWKDQGFSPNWIEAGLRSHELSFAEYLKQKNIQPTQLTTDDLFQLRKEFYSGYPQAQSYLDKYPQEERKNIREFNLRNLNLEGDLDLEGFLRHDLRVYVAGNPQLGEIKNKPDYTTLIYQNSQEFLNHLSHRHSNKEQVEKISLDKTQFDEQSELVIDNYPKLKEITKEITTWGRSGLVCCDIVKIIISNCPQLEKIGIESLANNSQLTLNNLPNLKHLDCFYNNLTTLDLTTCPNLKALGCSMNLLTEVKLPNSSRDKLEVLRLHGNNFLEQDLKLFSHLVNLKELDIGNGTWGSKKEGVYNRFTGSLEPLKKLTKLKELVINNTDIDSGLEYLPESVISFVCSVYQRKDAKCQNLYKLFANDQGEVETENINGYMSVKNFPQKLQEYKQKIQNQQQPQILQSPYTPPKID